MLGGACVVAVPAAALGVGLRIEGAVADPALVRALAVAVGATGAMVGVTLGLSAPTTPTVGVPLAVAPVRGPSLTFASTVAPTLSAVALAAAIALVLAVPAAGIVGAAAVLSGVASLTLGAAAGAASLASFPRRAIVPVAAGTWASVGAMAGVPEAGPAAVAVRAAAGAVHAVPVALLVTGVGVALWAFAAPRTARAPRRPRRRRVRRSRSLPLASASALAAALLWTLTRHRELRPPALAAVLLPVGATWAAALLLGVRGEAGAAFAVGLALATAIVFPAAASGVLEQARWLVAAAPQELGRLRRVAASVGVALAFALAASAAAGTSPIGSADAPTYLELEAATALVLGSAAAAGTIVAWRPAAPLQQASAYGAAAVTVAVAWAVAAQLVDVAAAVGLGATPYGLLTGHAVLVGGVLSAGFGSR